ncbi:MAG: Ulp1 family isopeptidase [Legionella sp.]
MSHASFFSLPTNLGEHSVAVVIDKQQKKVHVMDSLQQSYAEAEAQVSECIDSGILNGYTMTRASGIQQKDNISCGVHSAANIVEVITDISHGREPKDGYRLPERTPDEVVRLTSLFITANNNEVIMQNEANRVSALAFQQKIALKEALKKYKTTGSAAVLIEALEAETPPGSDVKNQ